MNTLGCGSSCLGRASLVTPYCGSAGLGFTPFHADARIDVSSINLGVSETNFAVQSAGGVDLIVTNGFRVRVSADYRRVFLSACAGDGPNQVGVGVSTEDVTFRQVVTPHLSNDLGCGTPRQNPPPPKVRRRAVTFRLRSFMNK